MLILNEIKKNADGLSFDENLDIKEQLMPRNPEVLDISDVVVRGHVSYDDGLYVLSYVMSYEITLPSSRSMEPVVLPQAEEVTEVFVASDDFMAKQELVEENLALILEEDYIDLAESAIDNILLAIPMRVLTPEEAKSEELPSGNSWSVLTEEQYQDLQAEKKKESSPFSALDGLFD